MKSRSRQIAKEQVGCLAADLVRSGMRVGLGTGSTAAEAIHLLGQRFVARQISFEAVCTSLQTEKLARDYGIPIVELEPSRRLDLYLDGADEIDSRARLLKGGGGALLREKLVAAMARRRVILVDESKLTPRLGMTHPVAVEVTRFGVRTTQERLEQLGCTATLRRVGSAPFVSDEGHYIIDCAFAAGVQRPALVERQIKEVLGVVDCGIFLDLCDEVIVGNSTRAERISLAQWRKRFGGLLRKAKRGQ